jgi:hypothetical protein
MKRNITTLLFAGFIFSFNSAYSQNSQDSVKQIINHLFIAMKNADAKGLEACFSDSAVLQTIINKENKTSVHNEPVSDFS